MTDRAPSSTLSLRLTPPAGRQSFSSSYPRRGRGRLPANVSRLITPTTCLWPISRVASTRTKIRTDLPRSFPPHPFPVERTDRSIPIYSYSIIQLLWNARVSPRTPIEAYVRDTKLRSRFNRRSPRNCFVHATLPVVLIDPDRNLSAVPIRLVQPSAIGGRFFFFFFIIFDEDNGIVGRCLRRNILFRRYPRTVEGETKVGWR